MPADTDLTVWPPTGATAVDVSDAYELLQGRGYHYGPVFQGLRPPGRSGDEVFAEVELPEQAHDDAEGFGLHPALLDATMHALGIGGGSDDGRPRTAVAALLLGGRVPVRGRRHGAAGTDLLDHANTMSWTAADAAGAPVAVREAPDVPPGVAGAAGRWSPGFVVRDRLASAGGSDRGCGRSARVGRLPEGELSGAVVFHVPAVEGPLPEAVRSVTSRTLAVVQEWLAQERFAETTLVVATRGAVVVEAGEGIDLAQAPVWGLVRAAQAENPGRIQLTDLNATDGDALAPSSHRSSPRVSRRARSGGRYSYSAACSGHLGR